ncbi:MAG: NAD(P)/FAD-dependent oxidoreductase, partial [Bdellovibrionota bacterium]
MKLKYPRYDCAVIGGGPGGLLATLYLRRYKRSVLLAQTGEPRALWIPRIRNLVGHTKGLTGPELMRNLELQAMRYKPDRIEGEASVERLGKRFLVNVGEEKFEADKVILATGMEDVQPPFTNYRKLRAKGLLAYCPICDGPDHCADKVGLLVSDNDGLGKIPFIWRWSKDLHVIATEKFRVSAKNRKLIEKHGVRFYDYPIKCLEAEGSRALVVRFWRHKPLQLRLAYAEFGCC